MVREEDSSFWPFERALDGTSIRRFPNNKNNEDATTADGYDMTVVTGATASVPTSTINLVKSILGGGVLALPASLAMVGTDPVVNIPMGVSLIASIGTMHAYYFHLLGRVCDRTGAQSYAQAWDRTVGKRGTVVSSIILLKTALACLCYSIILADSFHTLLDLPRNEALLGVTLIALFPLSILRDLSSLAPVSLAGLAMLGITIYAMLVRHFDGTYDNPQGEFFMDLHNSNTMMVDDNLLPVNSVLSYVPDATVIAEATIGNGALDMMQTSILENTAMAATTSTLVDFSLGGVALMACTLSTAFVAHYNAPKFHAELIRKDQFSTISYASYAIAAVAMAITAVAGYATFGNECQDVVLNSYSPNDSLITACRLLTALSLTATFPLPFVGLRDGIMDAFQLEKGQDQTRIAVAVALLALITGAASQIQNLALVLSIGGGTVATAVSSVFPTLMYRSTVPIEQRNKDPDAQLASILMWTSVLIGGTGVGLALQGAASGLA
jgi:amino acid permease